MGCTLGLNSSKFFVVHDFLHSDMTQPVQEKKRVGGGGKSLYMYIILYTPASFFLAQIESIPLLHAGAKNKSFFSIHYSKVELLKISLCCV